MISEESCVEDVRSNVKIERTSSEDNELKMYKSQNMEKFGSCSLMMEMVRTDLKKVPSRKYDQRYDDIYNGYVQNWKRMKESTSKEEVLLYKRKLCENLEQ